MQRYSINIHSFLFVGLLVSLMLTTGCQDDTIEISADKTFGIRHDVPLATYEAAGNNQAPYNTSDYPNFGAIVKFCYSLNGSADPEFIGTGTLVHPEWVLTAGHNFFTADEQTQPALVTGISVMVGADPNQPDETIAVDRLEFHPTWLSSLGDYAEGNDFCLVHLSRPITNITPMPINYVIDAEPLQEVVYYAGYGDYSTIPGQNADLLSKRHALQNILDRRTNNQSSTINGTTYPGGLLATDFDHPDGTVNSLNDDTVNRDEGLLGTGTSSAIALDLEGTTVQGDSGGPLIMKINGTWMVVGVLSGGASDVGSGISDSSYGDISIYMRTSSQKTWLQSILP